MLTAAVDVVDTPPRAVMWTVSQIADRDGVSKQAVSKQVSRLVDSGLAVERDRQGRVCAVNVAQYDGLRDRFGDPSKAQAPRRPAAFEAFQCDPKESYDEALRQKTWHEAERRRLDLDLQKGRLIETAAVAEGYDLAAAQIHDILGRLDDRADDLAAIVAREGVRGLQSALKRLGSDLLADVSRALAAEASRLRAGGARDADEPAAA